MIYFPWCWHKWTKWKDVDEVFKRYVPNNALVSRGVCQRRECLKCGKVELRTEWY